MRRLLVVLIALGLTACTQSFWDRSPRVAGNVQTPCPAPCPDPCPAPAPCPAPCPAPEAPICAPAPQPAPCPPTCIPDARVRPMPPATPPAVATAPLPNTWPETGGQVPTPEEGAVLDEVNRIRGARALRPLAFDTSLYLAAREHSREQAAYGYMGHGSPDPTRKTLAQRMQLAGYQGTFYGEVVAWGYRDCRSVVEGWMNSADHRAILIDSDLRQAAFSRIGDYWTGNFGTPRDVPSMRTRTRTSTRTQAPLPPPAPAPLPPPASSRPPVQHYFAPAPSPHPAAAPRAVTAPRPRGYARPRPRPG